MNKSANVNYIFEVTSSIFGKWFFVLFMIISLFTIFMTTCNCVVYGRIITNEDDPNISKGFAILLLIFNILLLLLALFGFFFFLLKWSTYNDIKNGYFEFNTQNVINATFNKQKTPVNNRNPMPINKDILKKYSVKDLENLSFQLKPEFMPKNPGTLQEFMNKYD